MTGWKGSGRLWVTVVWENGQFYFLRYHQSVSKIFVDEYKSGVEIVSDGNSETCLLNIMDGILRMEVCCLLFSFIFWLGYSNDTTTFLTHTCFTISATDQVLYLTHLHSSIITNKDKIHRCGRKTPPFENLFQIRIRIRLCFLNPLTAD